MISKNISPMGTVPIRSEATDETAYRQGVEAFLNALKLLSEEFGVVIPQFNSTAVTVNEKEASAVLSAQTSTNQASIAINKANEANASAASALVSKEAAEAIFDNFDDKYLGAKAIAPMVDNDGNPLVTGALYFKTTAPKGIYVYDDELEIWVSPTYVPTSHGSLSGLNNNDAHPISSITGLADELDKKVSLGGVRQTVQYASVNLATGQPNFVSIGTGLSVNISATAKNVKISAAGGDVDRIGKIIADTAISGLSANAINYLYADIASDGAVTLGSTTIAPQYVGGLANYELTAQTPTMTSNTAPSGIASVSSSYGGGYEAYKVFDKTITSSWQTPSGTTTGWLQYQFPTAKRITKYKITDFGSATYAPNSWTFLGSNDGTTWTTLDTRSGIVFTNSETKYFTFSNAVSYLYYKINITANNGGSDLGIGELELYSPIAGTNVFDIANMEMFNFDGTNYTKAWRVFLAEAVTNASAVTSVVNYALNGLYKSVPVAFSGAGTFNFNHNIGDKVENLVPIAFGKASADTYFSANPLGYAGGSLYPIFTNNTATTKSIAVSTQSGGILIGGGATTTGFISITVKRGW